MELVQASIFIPLLIVAATQIIKMLLPTVTGWLTIVVALALGVGVALADTSIGVADISVAQGMVLALGAIGLSTLAKKAGGAGA